LIVASERYDLKAAASRQALYEELEGFLGHLHLLSTHGAAAIYNEDEDIILWRPREGEGSFNFLWPLILHDLNLFLRVRWREGRNKTD